MKGLFLTLTFLILRLSSYKGIASGKTYGDTIKVQLDGIYWDFNRSQLKGHSFPVLDSIAGKLKDEWVNYRYTIYVVEFRSKTESYSLVIRRAESIAVYWMSKGIGQTRGKIDGDVKYIEDGFERKLPEVYLLLYK